MASDNLILRGGNWYVRLSVPADVRPVLNRREYTASLKTGSKQEAQRLKLPFLSAWRDAIAEARGLAPDRAESQREGAYLASQAIEQFLNESVTQTALGKGEGLAASFADLAERLNLSGPARQMAEMMFNKYQGQLDMEESVEMLKALAMHSQADVYTELNPVDPAEVKGILKDPNHYRSKSPITITRLNDFEDYQRRRGVVAKTVDTQLSRLKKLKAWLEDNQKELRHESIEVYLDTLDCANMNRPVF